MSNKSNSQVLSKTLLEHGTKIGDYVVQEKLGVGAYAAVYKAYRLINKNEVAIKCFEKARLSQADAIENLLTEIRILKTLRHPNIVEMLDFSWDERYVYIIVEYCDGGDLSKFIQKRQKLPERIVQVFLKQLAQGLFYLRNFNICHLDLKPSNLLIVTKPQLTLKIADFGLSQYLSNETYQSALRGSPLYMAPEMLLRRHFHSKIDLWSVGIITYECLFGKAPFASCTFKELRDKLEAETPIEIPENAGISRQCQELLRRLLKYKLEERIDYDQFFSHPFVDIAHQPSPRTYSYAVDLLHQAVQHDANKDFKRAFNLYCDALAYLIPHVHAEKDEERKKALKTRLAQYMDRAEAILVVTKSQQFHTTVSPNALKAMCESTPPLVTAIDLATTGDLFLSDGLYSSALEKYQIGLEMLIELIPKEPEGIRKEMLLRQTKEWVSQASRAKVLNDMNEIEATQVVASDAKDLCILQ